MAMERKDPVHQLYRPNTVEVLYNMPGAPLYRMVLFHGIHGGGARGSRDLQG